ncbi:MAG: glycosyltransferase [Candidatus Eisenbacteria bacterium]|nr:glycosyltransferase [Candidatus Eisenbacteria bacterium]
MRILFFSDNYPPETNAPAVRTREHARVWVERGHDVTVVTCAPNFPTGRLHEGYRNAYCVDTVDGVRVVRVWSYIAANKGTVRRSLDFLSFMLSAVPAGLLQSRPDVVVGTSPQLFAVVAAWLVARLRRAPCVFELRDLWPESIEAVGASGSSVFMRAVGRLAGFLYRHVDHIVCVTRSFASILAERGIPPVKISVVLNGVDLDEFSPRAADEEFRSRMGVGKDGMLVTYLGTVGMAHGLGNVLDAAELSGDERTRFLIVGEGAEKAALRASALERGLRNVIFLDGQPRGQVPRILSASDAVLVHLRDDPLFRTVIPSKIFEAMAMARPIVLAVRGESRSLVERTRSGIAVEPGNPGELVDAIERLASDPELRAELGRNGRRSAELEFGREEAAVKMLDVLSEVAAAS